MECGGEPMPGLNRKTSSVIMPNPHLVQLNVPERGFGNKLDAMVQFCLEHGEEFRIECFRESEGQDCILFRFRDPENAIAFAGRFDGEIFAVPPDDDLFLP